MAYKYDGVDNFYRETIERTRSIMSENPDKVSSYQMRKYTPTEKVISEEADTYLKKLVADFMGFEFDGIDFAEINYALMNQTDDVYNDWIEYSKMKGLSSPQLQALGWEMIFAGEFTYVPALQKFY